jgi:hypothetical protein
MPIWFEPVDVATPKLPPALAREKAGRAVERAATVVHGAGSHEIQLRDLAAVEGQVGDFAFTDVDADAGAAGFDVRERAALHVHRSGYTGHLQGDVPGDFLTDRKRESSEFGIAETGMRGLNRVERRLELGDDVVAGAIGGRTSFLASFGIRDSDCRGADLHSCWIRDGSNNAARSILASSE